MTKILSNSKNTLLVIVRKTCFQARKKEFLNKDKFSNLFVSFINKLS
jgi:hypothetical protein